MTDIVSLNMARKESCSVFPADNWSRHLSGMTVIIQIVQLVFGEKSEITYNVCAL